jgi:hypothetical protein
MVKGCFRVWRLFVFFPLLPVLLSNRWVSLKSAGANLSPSLERKGRRGGGERKKGIDLIKTRSTQHQSKKVNRLFNSSNSNQATQLSTRCSSKVSNAAFSKAKSELPAHFSGAEGWGKGGEGEMEAKAGRRRRTWRC